jgi:hypothetical protein
MYCHEFVAYECLEGDDRSHFRCANAECIGKRKLQVTCFWKIKEDEGEMKPDTRLEKRLTQISRSIEGDQN